jgi:hypothetical protein
MNHLKRFMNRDKLEKKTFRVRLDRHFNPVQKKQTGPLTTTLKTARTVQVRSCFCIG